MRKRITSIGVFVIAVGGLLFYRHSALISKGPSLFAVPPETMRVIISFVVTAASLFVILSKSYGPKDKHWAYATVGTVLGFWLNSK